MSTLEEEIWPPESYTKVHSSKKRFRITSPLSLRGNQGLDAIAKSIKLSFSRVHLLLLPYMVISLLAFIITKFFTILKFNYSGLMLAVVMLAYAAVIRYYVSELILKSDKYH